jgi:hypothetical protein
MKRILGIGLQPGGQDGKEMAIQASKLPEKTPLNTFPEFLVIAVDGCRGSVKIHPTDVASVPTCVRLVL